MNMANDRDFLFIRLEYSVTFDEPFVTPLAFRLTDGLGLDGI